MNQWIEHLFEQPDLLRMGHWQRRDDHNLGMGWLYYGLARLIRPQIVLVIGSYRGFAPVVFARALADNSEGGEVYFVDPSLVDDFWKDPERVRTHFKELGVTNIRHFLMTTQEFVETEDYRSIREIGIAFIDGYHTEEQSQFDYEAVEHLISPGGITLFHDSMLISTARIYGPERAYERRVKFFIDQLKNDPTLSVFDLPYSPGLTLVRKCGDDLLESDAH